MSQPTHLGKYQVVRELGQGSMGIVYEGYDAEIDRRVALKTVRSSGFSAEQLAELVARLRREARAVGRLHHTNIVALYELGEAVVPADDGTSTKTPYLAMEFIEGQELRSYFAHGERLPIAEVVRIMSELLDALEYAHSNGVVHRDIKPSNIILTRSGTVKLADFGIARMEWTTRYTQMGWVIGTPSYMPPEQFRGENVDLRADLYAAGVLLYELLTGRVPFEGEITSVMYKVLHEDPPAPSILNQELPTALDAIVSRALAKDPAARYQSAAEFKAAILGAASRLASGEKTIVRAGSRRSLWRRPPVRYGLTAAVILASAVALYLARPDLQRRSVVAPISAGEQAAALAARSALKSVVDQGQGERHRISTRVSEARTLMRRCSEALIAAKSDSERQLAQRNLDRAREELEVAEKAQLITEAHIFAADSTGPIQTQRSVGESELAAGNFARALAAFTQARGDAARVLSAVRGLDPALKAQQDLTVRLDMARRTVSDNSGNAAIVLAEPLRAAAQAGALLDEGQSIAALKQLDAANASLREGMRGFLEYVVGEYATIAQRQMAAHRLDVAQAAIERGKSLRMLERQFQ